MIELPFLKRRSKRLGHILKPIIPVSIIGPKRGVKVFMLLDSGADISMFSCISHNRAYPASCLRHCVQIPLWGTCDTLGTLGAMAQCRMPKFAFGHFVNTQHWGSSR